MHINVLNTRFGSQLLLQSCPGGGGGGGGIEETISEPHAPRVSSLYLVYVDTRHPLTGDDRLAGQLINDVRHVEVLCQVGVAADELLEALLAACLVLVVTFHGQLTLGHLHVTHSNTSTQVMQP